MGLTISYDLKTDLKRPQDVRRLVEAMRQHALDLPFKKVDEVKEFKGSDTGWEEKDDPDRTLKIMSGAMMIDGVTLCPVPPKHSVLFSTWPGEGCEPAIFGFCLYPTHAKLPSGKKQAIDKDGWCWHSFCTTQYASDPKSGGVENFVRCHLSVIKMLDFIKQTGLATVTVEDGSGYWEKRSLDALMQEIGKWNVFVSGAISVFRSLTGGDGTFEAPITEYQNFEHLEAKGLDRIADLRRKLGRGER